MSSTHANLIFLNKLMKKFNNNGLFRQPLNEDSMEIIIVTTAILGATLVQLLVQYVVAIVNKTEIPAFIHIFVFVAVVIFVIDIAIILYQTQ